MLIDAYQVRYLRLAGTPLSKGVARRGKIDVIGAKRRDVEIVLRQIRPVNSQDYCFNRHFHMVKDGDQAPTTWPTS